MSQYIDGFVLPVPQDRISEYQQVAESIAEIWIEHGALDYREYVGDDMSLESTRSFEEIVSQAESEIIVFGWVMFESRQARDAANQKVAEDPRMAKLIAPLVDPENPIFDAQRMLYGGFKALVQRSH